jgi:hypothetical protein
LKYSPRARLAYFHIHRTGGSSVKCFLGEVFPDFAEVADWPHHSLSEYFVMLRHSGVDPDELRILTTIRHPFSHVVSIYESWRRAGDERRGAHVRAARSMQFADFVRHYVSSTHPDARVYEELLFVDNRVPSNVRIMRLENLAVDADWYLNRELQLGVPVALSRSNGIDHPCPSDYYDANLRALVRSRYRWVFDEGFY